MKKAPKEFQKRHFLVVKLRSVFWRKKKKERKKTGKRKEKESEKREERKGREKD